MTVIAEGVETAEQHQQLVALDCDSCQGYYFARPMPPEDFDALCDASFVTSLPLPAVVVAAITRDVEDRDARQESAMSNFNVLVLEASPNCVFIAGDIDVVSAPRVAEVLCDLRGDITVDCTEISFIDSAGFKALDRGYLVATAAGNTFDVTGLRAFHAQVAEILQVPYVRTAQ